MFFILRLFSAQIINGRKFQYDEKKQGKKMLRSKKSKKILCLLLSLLTLLAIALPVLADNNEAIPNEVVVGGCFFGVKLYTDGVPVVGIDGFETENGVKAPAHDAGIKLGDVIKTINGVSVTTSEQITAIISSSGGERLNLTVLREGKEKSLVLIPVKSVEGIYRAGMWIRDNALGIGTVTYVNPNTLEFGGLGHGICDSETASLMPMLRGSVSDIELTSVVKGKCGAPGEVKGVFKGGKTGALTANTHTGVYGAFAKLPSSLGEKMHLADAMELKEGEAFIRTAIGGKPEDYKVKISKINCRADNGKNFVIDVTDERLIDISGGIVQGMSGSPVIQNGKLIGAVTHVTVNEPTKGYGIFIGNMVK